MLSIALVIGQHIKYQSIILNVVKMVTINLRYRLLLKFILYKQNIPGKQVFFFFKSHLELQMYYITWTTKIHIYMYKKMFILKEFFTVYFF